MLQLGGQGTWLLWECGVRRYLRAKAMGIVGQHVDAEQIGEAVAVHVADVETHRRVARLPLGGPIGKAKIPPPVVEPELVGILEVVRDIQIGRTIAIQIDKARPQRKRFELLRHGLPGRVSKPRRGQRGAGKMPGPVVDVEVVRRRALRESHAAQIRPHDDLVVTRKGRHHLEAVLRQLPHDLVECALLRRNPVVDVVRFVVRHIEREPAAAVHISHGNRCPAAPRGVEPEVSALGKMPLAVVDKNRVGPGRGEQNQVEVAVTVNVGERRARRMPVAGTDTGRQCDLFELPVAEVSVQRGTALGAGEEDVNESVTICVAERHTSALSKDPVRDECGIADRVGKRDPGRRTRHRREPRARTGDAQLPPPVAGSVVPGRRCAGATRRDRDRRHCGGQRRQHGDPSTHDPLHRAPTRFEPAARAATAVPIQVPRSRPLALPLGK